jgi:hypothetical protein
LDLSYKEFGDGFFRPWIVFGNAVRMGRSQWTDFSEESSRVRKNTEI